MLALGLMGERIRVREVAALITDGVVHDLLAHSGHLDPRLGDLRGRQPHLV